MKNYIIPVTLILTVMLGGYLLVSGIKSEFLPEDTLKGVASGEEMHSTSTANMNKSAIGLNDGGSFTVQEHRSVVSTTPFTSVTSTPITNQRYGSITLGSVAISSSSVGTLIIRDATSTSDKASTTVAFFDNDYNSTGIYSFDLILTRGIMLDFSAGFNGSYIITYR